MTADINLWSMVLYVLGCLGRLLYKDGLQSTILYELIYTVFRKKNIPLRFPL